MSQADDTELNRYLEGDSELSQAYRRTRHTEPPASVDEFVLNAARQREARNPRRWLPPLAAAAVVLLGVTTTLSLLQDEAIISMDDFSGTAGMPLEAEESPPQAEQAPAEDRQQQKSSARALHDSERESAVRGERAAPPPAVLSRPAVPQRNRKAESADDRNRRTADTANDWIERIRSLRQAGLEDAARREFAAFRKLYPDRDMPEDLQDLDRALRDSR